MKILIYIPPAIDSIDIHHELSTRLAQSLEREVAVELLHDLPDLSRDTLGSYQLIHVMGCWSGQCAALANKSRHLQIPIVYSPLGGLQPWVLKTHKQHAQATYRKAIGQASAVHVCSPLEHTTFTELGWNARMTLIKNPVLTSLTSFDAMSRDMLTLYRKVVDSHARMLMAPEEQQLIGDLLQVGVNQRVLINASYAEQLCQQLQGLDDACWRRLLIYAHDEHITSLIQTACKRLQIATPDLDIEAIDRFAGDDTYSKGPLNDQELIKSTYSVRTKMSERLKTEQVGERRLCTALLNLRHELNHHTAPLLHLADLYSMLRFGNVDEDLVFELVKALGIGEFSQQLMGVLSRFMHLSEGFLPFPGKDDKATVALEKALTKFGKGLD